MKLVQRLARLRRSAGAAGPLHRAAAGNQMRVPCRDGGCGHRVCDAYRDGYDEGYADGLAAARVDS